MTGLLHPLTVHVFEAKGVFNVWPLGLIHGALGVLFYYWVLERDPWPELLASIGLVSRPG